MANKPVKVLADLLTKKQILKQDLEGNTLFLVSGTLANGQVSSSLPIYAANGIYGRLYGTASYALNIPDYVNEVYTAGSVTGSGLISNPITLTDPLIIGTITSSYIYSPQITGTLYGTASYASNAGNINTTDIKNAYKRLRYQEVGFFDNDGTKIIELPSASLDGAAFPVSSFDYINVSVFVKEEERWLNDLLAVQLYTSSTNVFIELSAPSIDENYEYKLLVVNENPDDYVI